MKTEKQNPSEAVWDNACNNAARPQARIMTMQELSAAVAAIAEKAVIEMQINDEKNAKIVKLAMCLGADYAWKIIYDGGEDL